MTFNSTDRAFLDGEIVVKVESKREAKYLIGIALADDKYTEYTKPEHYARYSHFVIESDMLIAYAKITDGKHLEHLTQVNFEDFTNDEKETKTDRGSLVADSTCQ
ncbi:hypothetical protein [Clostridium sp. HBUAS56010]|uniref:hypothetical protein n=1 Tax=Clostridium sp. HBUAS56010 TaxID=2571127 RepID=UPI001177D04D|nr:hypothetical protein [Clostridium sp. HBUAS56010]